MNGTSATPSRSGASTTRMASLRFTGGRIFLPATTAYDYEILAEHLRATARRYGSIELQIGAHRWSVRSARDVGSRCASCTGSMGDTAFQVNDGPQCENCATGGLLRSRDRRNSAAA